MNILFLDIESSPNTAHVWGLFKQNIGINQLLDSSYVLCWAAKWYGEKEIHFDSVYQSSSRKMLRGIHKLLEKAEAVVHYNGTRFDIPTLNKEFVLHGMKPPAPYNQIDLLKVARNKFRFPSNRLDYVADALGEGKKTPGIGHELWIRCMNNDPDAWEMMEEYNKNDVILLERVYERFKPWIKGHANFSLFRENLVCPNCASEVVTKRGFAYTSTQKYQRYVCGECGNWFRGGKSLAKGPEEKYVNL
jgi:predicted RNA-binding Zn-ribbon protein involved in translation (DUF1610 family)